MNLSEIKKQIEKLNLDEKIILVEDVWNSIARSNSDLPLSEWQKKELDKRYSEFLYKNEKLTDWDSVHEDLKKKYK